MGKTVLCIKGELVHSALTCPQTRPQYAYIAPTYKQAKLVAWEMLLESVRDLPGVKINQSELKVEIDRPHMGDKSVVYLLSSDNPDAIRGVYLDGVILDEYAQCDPRIWGEVVRPALSDRKGWAIFISTPKGPNHFKRLHDQVKDDPEWLVMIKKASETGLIDDDELTSARKTMTPEQYDQEYECSFSAGVLGAYYAHLIKLAREEARVGNYPYDPSLPVDTFWDLGIGDALTICFRQLVHGRWRYIDYYEVNGKGLPEVVREVKSYPYVYGRHVLPWDAKARDLSTGVSRQETLRKLGLRVEIQKRQAVDDRIQAARLLLPKAEFDVVKCARLLECLDNYQKEWDNKLQVFKSKPKHDWSSHGADAFGYSALDTRTSSFRDEGRDLPRQAECDYDEFGGV